LETGPAAAGVKENEEEDSDEKENDTELEPEPEAPENTPKEPSGVEFHEGHYEGNTYVVVAPEDHHHHHGGLKLKKDSFVTLRAIFGYRFPGSHITVGDVVIATIYVAINVMCYFISPEHKNVLSIGAATPYLGFLIGANSVLVVMFATKNSILFFTLGIAFERAVLFHRWLGRWTGILIFIHFVLSCVKYSPGSTSSQVAASWIAGYNSPIGGSGVLNFWGLMAGIVYILIFVSSLEWFRRNAWEFFAISHVLVIAYFIFCSFHTPKFLIYAYISVALVAFDLILRFFLGTSVLPVKTTMLRKRGPGIVQMRFPKRITKKVFYHPGQYVFINIPSISKLQWHPFSISSAPHDKEIEVNIRSLGNWTSKVEALVQSMEEGKALWIRADGPFGNLRLNYYRYKTVVFVAGGVGITPSLGMLRDIFDSRKKKRSRIARVIMIWAVPVEEEANWFLEDLKHIHDLSQKSHTQLDLRVYLTRADENAQYDAPLYAGRPDKQKILEEATSDREPSFVFVCGPRKMVNETWDCANALQRGGKICHFHHETFHY